MSDKKKTSQEEQVKEDQTTDLSTEETVSSKDDAQIATTDEPSEISTKEDSSADSESTKASDAVEATVSDSSEPEKNEKPTAAEASTEAPKEEPNKEKKPATWPGKLALPISIIALGAAGYLYWLSLQQSNDVSQSNAQLQTQVENAIKSAQSSLDQNIASMNQKLGQLQAQSQADKNNIDELQTRLTKSIQQVTAKQQTSRKDWLIAEVEYLLRLANQRVLMEQTSTGALALLKSADKILQETDDVTIYEVRKALADDIAALEAVPTLDTEGVFLKLGALSRQVPNLRLIPISEQRQLPELIEEVTPEVMTESWSAGLKESWGKAVDKLDQLVVIRHRDEPVEPLLSPKQSYYLQQNLLLMLEQAQLAMLQKKQASFDASLSKAHEWVSTYFEQKDGTTQSLLRGIAELQEIKVTAEMPDISGSLRSLKGYLKEMTKLKEQGAS